MVEVGRDGDDGLGDFLTETDFGIRLELGENHRRDLGRAVSLLLAVRLDLDVGIAVGSLDHLVRHALDLFLDLREFTAHEPFDRIDRVPWVRNRLPFGGLTHQPFATLGKRDHGRRRPFTFGVLQNHRLPAFHHGHAGVGGS